MSYKSIMFFLALLFFVGCSNKPSDNAILDNIRNAHAQLGLLSTQSNYQVTNTWFDENVSGVYYAEVQYDIFTPDTHKFVCSWQETWMYQHHGNRWDGTPISHTQVPNRQ